VSARTENNDRTPRRHRGGEEAIKVYVVDDHGMVRRGMRSYLEMFPDIAIVGEASGGQAAIDGIAALAEQENMPHVVIMDLLMPGMDGIACTAMLKGRYPEMAVVAVSSFIAHDRVLSALQAGAVGYILKDAEADELSAAIRAARGGEVYLAPAAAIQLARALRDPTSEGEGESLTDRERQVLALVAEGASNKTIASALSISERTARTHVSNILMKLGVGSRTQAALWAIREERGSG
jgi:DNA-binding NarL/FixJ family response regulator